MLQTEYDFATELAVRGAEEREAGILLGMQKGMQKGRNEERLSIAQIMKSENCPISLIIKATGLTQTEIENI